MKRKFKMAGLILALLLAATGTACGKENGSTVKNSSEGGDGMKQILDDVKFENGFGCMGVTSADHYKVEKELEIPGAKGERRWLIAPWATRHGFENEMSVHQAADGAISFFNVAKDVTVYPGKGKITLMADAGEEYERPRKADEPWIHLLLEQVLPSERKVPFSQMESCVMELEFSVSECKNLMSAEEYNPNIHAAQASWFITVENSKSTEVTPEGRPDYMWFGLPLYDNRGGGMDDAYQMDYGTMKLIYSVGKNSTLKRQVEIGKKYRIAFDVLPEIRKAFELAQQEGSLVGAKFEDMVIGSMNLGWELPGAFRAKFEIDKIGIVYSEKTNQ